MDWKSIVSSLDRGQREQDVSGIVECLRQILAHLSLVDGLGASNSVFLNDAASKSQAESVFAETTKLLAFKHPLVRKLAGWVLLIIGNRDYFDNDEVYLLAVNSLVANGTAHPDYLTRGKSLTVSWQLGRQPSSSYSSTTTTSHPSKLSAESRPELHLNTHVNLDEKALKDCEYVRRLAVLFAFDEQAEDGDHDVDRLLTLLEGEVDPVVIVNAFVVLAGTQYGDSRLTKKMCLSALAKLDNFSEPSKASFVTVLAELTRHSKIEWVDEDVIALLNLLDGCLEGSGCAANLVVASGFLLRVVESSTLQTKDELLRQVVDRILPSLWMQLDKGPEISHQVIHFLLEETEKKPILGEQLTRGGIEWCFISPRDPVFLILKKIEVFVKLATSASTNGDRNEHSTLLHAILSQLFTWTTASFNSKIVETSLLAVTTIRNLAMKTLLEASAHTADATDEKLEEESETDINGRDGYQAVFRRCMNHVLNLLDQPSPIIVASALNALKEALRDFDDFSVDVAKDATEDDVAAEDEAASQAKTYLHQLMSKIPRCIDVLRNASNASLREKALSAILFLLEKYSWALRPSASPAYILEDLFSKHFVTKCRDARDKTESRKIKSDRTSSKLKFQLLSTALKIFAKRPNETLPIIKEILSRFDRDQDLFLSFKSHKLFYLHNSL